MLASAAAVKAGTVLAKYRVKLAGRLALLALTGPGPGEGEVREEVEVIVQDMLEALSNKVSSHKSPRDQCEVARSGAGTR